MVKYFIGICLVAGLCIFGPLAHGAQTNIYFRILGSGESLTGEAQGGSLNPYLQNNQNDSGQLQSATGLILTGNIATGNTLPGDISTGNILGLVFSGSQDPWRTIYEWAKPYGIVNSPEFSFTNLNASLTRIELARMTTTFVKNVWGKQIVADWKCDITAFSDYDTLTSIEKVYAKEACDLGLMGWKAGKSGLTETFRPRQLVGRDTLGIVISRMLYGSRHDASGLHVQNLIDAGYMVNLTEALRFERRGYAMAILKKIAENPPLLVYAMNYIPEPQPTTITPVKPSKPEVALGTGSAEEPLSAAPMPEETPPIEPILAEEANKEPDPHLFEAFNWAKQYEVTLLQEYDEAALLTPITRAELARIMVQIAINVLRIPANKSLECDLNSYQDQADIPDALRGYVKQACEMSLMGISSDGMRMIDHFKPTQPLTRAEFATVLSRFLYGNTYMQSGENWYQEHLTQLNKEGFIKRINDPYMLELRGYVMIILQRIEQKFKLTL